MTAVVIKSYHLDFKDQGEQGNGKTTNIVVETIIGITDVVEMFNPISVITKLMTLVFMITKKTMMTMNSLVSVTGALRLGRRKKGYLTTLSSRPQDQG
jgi:hypothetical protein